MNLVGIVGKIGSGKSTAAEVFVESGYKRIAFADYVKETLAEHLEIPLKWFYTEEGKNTRITESPTVCDDGLYNVLEDWLTCLAINNPWCQFEPAHNELYERADTTNYRDLHILTFRELLQYAGTELLRACDPGFHVKVTMEQIKANPNERYVMDDVRFPNELEAVREVGGVVIKLLRNWDSGATHASETALDRIPDSEYDFVYSNQTWTKEHLQDWIEETIYDLTPVTSHDNYWREGWYEWVRTAMENQRERYGNTNAQLDVDDPFLLAITTEQLGKAADMLNYLRLHSTTSTYPADLKHLRDAIIGVVASGAMWLEKFE